MINASLKLENCEFQELIREGTPLGELVCDGINGQSGFVAWGEVGP
jgi:hypothetical protein